MRHTHASKARIELNPAEDELTLRVTDDGRGFAPDAEAGIGLRSIRERATELGGRVELAHAVGGGAQIQARFALASVRE